NEPGRENWEGFETAPKAAAAGGITMLVDMPLNSSPVTIDADSFYKKITAAKGKLYVACGFYGGIVPGNEDKIEELIKCGVLGFKAFMIHSGIEDFPDVNEADLRKALDVLKRSGSKLPLLVHAELNIGKTISGKPDTKSYSGFLESRPREMENKAIRLLIDLSREYDYHIHIVHLSSSDAIGIIKKAKAEGVKITVETCPHYLFFSSENIDDNDTRFKCTPPIRENENREKLWEAVEDGLIDLIVSDHSPCDPDLKFIEEGDCEKAWGGVSSLQLGLSVVWTEAVKRKISIEKISKLMSSNTSAFIGMNQSKGKIENGFDADLVIFDPTEKFTVEKNLLYHKHRVTPYIGCELTGKVIATYLNGEKIFENGKIINSPTGKIILKKSL
ncbi:MAG: allantoinase AllB, partial [bacterium]